MIPRIKRILYATDLSKNSAYAFRYAVNSAQKHDAEIVILHVWEKLPLSMDAVIEMQIGEAEFESFKKKWEGQKTTQIERIRKRLIEFVKREPEYDPQKKDPVSDIVVIEGVPEAEILKKIDELKCDILIMGTNSHGSLNHAFLGSVAERVLRRIRKPVYLIPIPTEDTDVTFRNI